MAYDLILGIDQSKRSTALVLLKTENYELVDFSLITPDLSKNNEELIAWVWTETEDFIKPYVHTITAIAFEGAAYTATGSSNDLLWGLQWFMRTSFYMKYTIPVGIITVSTWRASILTREEQRTYKLEYGGKIGLKVGVKEKLPKYVLAAFNYYLETHKNRINMAKGKIYGSKSNAYLDGIFDLADAWGIAKYRIDLFKGIKKPVPPKKKKEKPRTTVLKRRFPNA